MAVVVVDTLRERFDFIYELLEKDIDGCPDTLWNTKTGGYYYWQQIVHAYGIIDYFIGTTPQTTYAADEVRLLKDGVTVPSKAEVLSLAKNMRAAAHTFFDGMTDATLLERNEGRSQRAGYEVSHLSAMISLIGHGFYHVGACDALLREHGGKGAM